MRVAQWSPEVAVLASVHDLLAHLVSVTYQVNGNKAPRVTPYPRPSTAAQRAQLAAKHETQDMFRRMLYPSQE